jgi:hypothetical protein
MDDRNDQTPSSLGTADIGSPSAKSQISRFVGGSVLAIDSNWVCGQSAMVLSVSMRIDQTGFKLKLKGRENSKLWLSSLREIVTQEHVAWRNGER